jgi:hypothetical protein
MARSRRESENLDTRMLKEESTRSLPVPHSIDAGSGINAGDSDGAWTSNSARSSIGAEASIERWNSECR